MDSAEYDRLHAERTQLGLSIDPANAEVFWKWGEIMDLYGDWSERDWILDRIKHGCDDPDVDDGFDCIGRLYFARTPGSGEWICFYDLPKATSDILWKRMDSNDPSLKV